MFPLTGVRYQQVTRCLLTLLLMIAGLPSAEANRCDYQQEQNIVSAILNQGFSANDKQLDRLIDQLDPDHALIPEPGFYRGLAIWYDGYQRQDTARKNRGIELLRSQVENANQRYRAETPRNRIIKGLISAYTARALFENEQIIRGYRTGVEAVEHLLAFIDDATPQSPGYYDAKFLLGLYTVYTHELQTRSHWLIGTVNKVGNKRQAVNDIIATINSNAVFSREAARAFLAEVNWRTPQICQYRKLAINSHRRLPDNVDLALLSQGVFLKCGQPQQALDINNRYHNQAELPDSVRLRMLKARLRVYADLGDTAAISSLQLPSSLQAHAEMALANALDHTGKRNIAVEKYRGIASTAGYREAIKRVARVRQTYPYRQPAHRDIDTLGDIAPVCGGD